MKNTSGSMFVVIDSTQYTITSVTIPDHSPRTIGHTQDINPVEGRYESYATGNTSANKEQNQTEFSKEI